VRRLASLALLLLAGTVLIGLCSLSFAFGDEPPEAVEAGIQAPKQAEPIFTPQQIEEQRQAEEQFEAELSTPAAEQERGASRTEFEQMTASEASELLDESFAPTLEGLDQDPGRLLSATEVEKMLGPDAARISSPETGRMIVESSAPLVTSVDGERPQPIDLTLEESGGSFSPVNPVSPTQLPDGAEGPVEVGEGVRVGLPASDDHAAVRVGQMSLFYPETESTTDTLISPVAGGVEIFEQLRSIESPEELRFDMELPDGARLSPTPAGGASAIGPGGDVIEEIPPPSAVDAQGAAVPVVMDVGNDTLVLHVGLAASQPAFPVLVDPLYKEESTNFQAWGYDSTAAYGAIASGSSLELWSQGNNYGYGPYTHGAYTYTSPGPTAWIEAATFNPVIFFANSCGGNQPHGYVGLYNPGAGRWEKEWRFEGTTSKQGVSLQTGWIGRPGTEYAAFGIGTDGAGSSLSCIHEFYLGGYSIQEKDETRPELTSVTGVPLGHWFDPEGAGPATITAAGSGFGVYEVSVGNEGAVTNHERPNFCTGVYGSRCPHTFTWSNVRPAYERGKRAFHVWARDPMENQAVPFSGETWVDPYKPEIELHGQFARATEEVGHSDEGKHNSADGNKLRLPTYELQISATDGSRTNPLEMESGVQRVRVLLDGVEQSLPWGTQTCPAAESSCPLSGTYNLMLSTLSAGVHKLKVLASDRLGHTREREIEFEYVPVTGEGEEQVLERFPLPDGEGEDGKPQPEVAVNVINGNLVYHQQDAEVATADAGLPVERVYNSQLPAAQSSEIGSGWTIGDAPEIEPHGSTGTIVQGDGTIETSLALPQQQGQTAFDPTTHTAIEKDGPGFAVADEAAEPEQSADLSPSGLVSELPGSDGAALDFERVGGELSEIMVDDPGTAAGAEALAGIESQRGLIPVATAGGENSSGGNLSRPIATATDPSGVVYVADAGHDRVQEFSSTGGFVRQWGGAGAGKGQFDDMIGIAVSGGFVYVAEPTRIEEFDLEGAFVREWGGAGHGEGRLNEVRALAADPAGNIWALDMHAEDPGQLPALEEFTSAGKYVKRVPVLEGDVGSPTGLAVGSEGKWFWMLDSDTSQLKELALTQPNHSWSTVLAKTVGGPGAGAGLFASPTAVALDGSGNVWVADSLNDRVEEFGPTGSFIRQAGTTGGGNLQFSGPTGISVGSSGNVWVADPGNDRVEKLTAGGAYFAQAGGALSGPGHLSRPVGTGVDMYGNVFVADAGHDRVQEFDSAGAFVREWGGAGTGSGHFLNMVGIAVDPLGEVFVAEPSRVQEFSPSGNFVRQIGSERTNNGQFTDLGAITLDHSGHLWALDRTREFANPYRIQEFSSAGAYMNKFEINPGSAAGRLFFPRGIAVSRDGYIYIADSGNRRIAEFEMTGTPVRQFGTEGSGAGQMGALSGIAVDATGCVWVTDTGNDRVEEFGPTGAFLRQSGTPGLNLGQFSSPGGLAVENPSGTQVGKVWVADTANDRLQELSPTGESLRKVGGANSEGGRLSHPVGAAVDSTGDAYVADTGHGRVQEFSPTGAFIRQWGAWSSLPGRIGTIVGIAIGNGDNVYVAESTRIVEFTPAGAFIREFGSEGLGNGQFERLAAIATDSSGRVWALDQGGAGGNFRIQELGAIGTYMASLEIARGSAAQQASNPRGIAIDKEGHIYVADTGNSRVEEFRLATPTFVRSFGSPGAAPGDLSEPMGITLDAAGNVWVADTGNDRAEEFGATGTFLARFGRAGDDEGLMSVPLGIDIDAGSNVWVVSEGNDRVDKFEPSQKQSAPPIEPAPSAEVVTSTHLVQSITGSATGSIAYGHEGNRLTSVTRPEATSKYGYGGAGRLRKIELPHGTRAEIEYDAAGRAQKLKVAVEGGPLQTTLFEYPTTVSESTTRETIVRREGKPASHYAIGEEGSVLRWWDTATPPEIEEPTGSLWAQRTEVHPEPISPGDHSLVVKAVSPHGIASIQLVANGSQVVAERSCEKEHPWECLSLEHIYNTEAEDWNPGMLSIEVIATDAIGGTSAIRMEDNVPYIPSHPDDELEAPTFADIKRFREEFGLDLDLKHDERAIAERIFNLIDAWHEPDTSEGEVARSSAGRWGVPLRPVDVAELEYRERYAEEAARLIPDWAEGHAESTYAGYYINQRQGGRIHIGFTGGNQSAQLSQLVSAIGEVAPGRLSTFDSEPSYSYAQLLEAWRANSTALNGQPIATTMVAQAIDMPANRIQVQTENVTGMETFLAQRSDPAKYEVVHGTKPSLRSREATWTKYGERPPRFNVREEDKRIFAGDVIMGEEGSEQYECTASWGATAPAGGLPKPNGEKTSGHLLITAGHCWPSGTSVYRFAKHGTSYVEFPIGSVTARSYGVSREGNETDAEAITLKSGFSPSAWIFANQGSQLKPGTPALPVVGEPVCHSGVEGGFKCGTVKRLTEQWFDNRPTWVWEASINSCDGDSGGPYWQPDGNTPLGIETGGTSIKLPDGRECGEPAFFTPLLESQAEEMGIKVGRNVGVLQALGIPGLTFYGAVN
jgi:tripartite motif-containing protein 71